MHFSETVFNQIFNIYCLDVISVVQLTEKHSKSWICCRNRMFTKFSNIAFSENCGLQILKIVWGFKLRPEMRHFLDVEHKAIPYRASSVRFATGNVYPFRTLPVWVQKFEIWITRYPWENKLLEMFRNSSIYGSNALEISLQSDQKWTLQSGTKISVLKAL